MTDVGSPRLYTGAARAAMERAARHAADWGHTHTTPLDLLLALVDDHASGMVTVILGDLRITPIDIRRAIAGRAGTAAASAAPIAPVLECALQQNPTLPVGSDHLLIGLLAADGGATDVLAAQGVTVDAVRAARTAASSAVCYGCAEGDSRPTPYTIAAANLPDDLTKVLDDIEHWRNAKEQAVDAGDFERAARMRDKEKKARAAVAEWDESTVCNRLGIALDEILRLRMATDRLTELLHHRHAAVEANRRAP
ncbi:Clp protease N-terminal domain-containing protein [Nocardia sp. NBC_00403]|uniref:Clp protease N-terminal domain-containing protein n=1 Tax=Nocardia sp. NBC_00403 TaxID=2975990 RepID=UPI002E233BDE